MGSGRNSQISLRAISPESPARNIDNGGIIFGKADYETALDSAGYGWYTYKILISCCLCSLQCGLQNGLSAYILPPARCDFSMTTYQMGLVNVGFMTGGIASAFVWGIHTDILGRRMTLLVNMFLDSIVTLAVAFSNCFVTLLMLRTLNGFFVGAPSFIVFAYLGDLVGFRKRRLYFCITGLWLTLSYLLLPALAWTVIPSALMQGFSSWRLFQGLLCLPGFSASACFIYLPESPRLMLTMKKSEEALDVLRKIYSKNFGYPPSHFPVKQLLRSDLNDDDYSCCDTDDEKKSRMELFKMKLSAAMKQTNALFHGNLLKNTLLGMFANFANMFGGFGLGLWIPELLSRLRKHNEMFPQISSTICQLQDWMHEKVRQENASILFTDELNDFANFTRRAISNQSPTAETLVTISESCRGLINTRVYVDTILMGLTCFVFNTICTVVSPRLNVRFVPFLSAMLAGLSTLLLYWAKDDDVFLAASCMFQSATITGNNVIVHMILYLFPKNVSPMALSMCTFAGRLGAIFCNLNLGILLDIVCVVPLMAVVIVSAIGGLCILFMRDCDKQPIGRITNMATNGHKMAMTDVSGSPEMKRVNIVQTDCPFLTSHM